MQPKCPNIQWAAVPEERVGHRGDQNRKVGGQDAPCPFEIELSGGAGFSRQRQTEAREDDKDIHGEMTVEQTVAKVIFRADRKGLGTEQKGMVKDNVKCR